ncbi:MAG: T9SS type A sorting domain-containing protein [Marinilabiliaceae bacterium]|nr:T9SS type A sorting domain-containing protein [Marinilabiliaceae bacterium]
MQPISPSTNQHTTIVRKLTLLVILIGCYSFAQAQLSFGGKPLWQSQTNGLKSASSNMAFETMPPFDAAIYEPSSDEMLKTTRFAHPFFVQYTPSNSGHWSTTNDGTRVWRLGISSPGAYTLNLLFDRFNIPDGARMFIFSADMGHVIGSFTNQSHTSQGVFATIPVAGDRIIVEYSQDAWVEDEPDILISAVNHDFKNFYATEKVGLFNDAGSCNVDVSCAPVAQDEHVRAVVRLVVDGREYCTGTLVNNSLNDGTPYVLSANHCLKNNYTNPAFVYLFNYQVPDCQSGIEGDRMQSMSGGQIVIADDNLDVLLINMPQMPPISYRPYWAGWYVADTQTAPVHSIHHPMGDVKKYASSQSAPTKASFSNPAYTFATDAHWRVSKWDVGTTEGGSSGCGLFNSNQQIIGTLSGGEATCDRPLNDYFARVNKAWDYQTDINKKLKTWLNPDHASLAVTSMPGFDFYESRGVKRITNRLTSETPVLRDNYQTGFWLGHNASQYTAMAEKFDTIERATLHGIYLMAGKRTATSQQSIGIKIWSGEEFSSANTPLLDTSVVISTLKAPAENFVRLISPLVVNTPVSISVSYNYATTDSIGIYWMQPSTQRTQNTVYLHKNGIWTAFNELHPSGIKTSAYLELLASDITFKNAENPEDSIKTDEYVVVYPNPARETIHYEWGNDILQKVEIFNLNGQKVAQRYLGSKNSNNNMPVTHLSAGIYAMKFYFNKKIITQKVIITH